MKTMLQIAKIKTRSRKENLRPNDFLVQHLLSFNLSGNAEKLTHKQKQVFLQKIEY